MSQTPNRERLRREPKHPQVPPDPRDEIVDDIGYWTGRTELAAKQFLSWLALGPSPFHSWKQRSGRVHEQNGKIPRDHGLDEWEKRAILDDHDCHPLEGYRRVCFFDDDRPRPSSSLIGRRPRLLAR